MQRFFISLILIIIAVGCDEPLDFTQPDYQSKLVVDGYIENGKYPVVILTRSSGYFDPVDSLSIRRLLATTAKVTVSDGERAEILTLKKHQDFFPPFYFQGTELKGVAGKTYRLEIVLEGTQYEAYTTIPSPPALDSLWFQPESNKDGQGLIYGRFHDPLAEENYYRTFTKRNTADRKYVPVYLSAVGDQFFNGKSFTFSLLRGTESLSSVDDDTYFSPGDTVDIRFCAIDRVHFDFWRTLERELYVVGNPFASSGNEVMGNISHDALGVWGGYGAVYYRLIIPID